MDPIHLVGLNNTIRLPVFRWKARGYDWILVDSIEQTSGLPAWQVPIGEGKGEERELVGIPFNLFFPSFAPAMQAK